MSVLFSISIIFIPRKLIICCNFVFLDVLAADGDNCDFIECAANLALVSQKSHVFLRCLSKETTTGDV